MMAALVELREKAGVSQRELARRLDRAHSYVGRIETGDRRLDLPEFVEWCELLEADPVEVLQGILKR
jgi:transcriptional regulator with XRE-family HTH domain